jgi:predicted PurR-regulated permease PerM
MGEPAAPRARTNRLAPAAGLAGDSPPSQVSPRTVWTVALHLLLILAALAVLYAARGVIAWIAVALFVALSLDPAVRFLEARRLPRSVSVLAVMAGLLGVVALLVVTLVPMLIEQGRALVAAGPDLLERLRASQLVGTLDGRFGLIARAKRELASDLGGAAGPVVRVLGTMLHLVAATVTTVVLATFMLLFGGALFRSLLGWVPARSRDRAVTISRHMHRAVGGYVSGTLLIALIGGVITAVALLLLGVPYFLPLGLAMALLGVVPFLGATLGGALMVSTTFLSSGVKSGLVALVIFVVYQQVENHLLQPLIQRHTIKMNPLAIALVMLVGTACAGVLGALLSLPLVAAAQILIEDLRRPAD